MQWYGASSTSLADEPGSVVALARPQAVGSGNASVNRHSSSGPARHRDTEFESVGRRAHNRVHRGRLGRVERHTDPGNRRFGDDVCGGSRTLDARI
jgi:hypothetical protein